MRWVRLMSEAQTLFRTRLSGSAYISIRMGMAFGDLEVDNAVAMTDISGGVGCVFLEDGSEPRKSTPRSPPWRPIARMAHCKILSSGSEPDARSRPVKKSI